MNTCWEFMADLSRLSRVTDPSSYLATYKILWIIIIDVIIIDKLMSSSRTSTKKITVKDVQNYLKS